MPLWHAADAAARQNRLDLRQHCISPKRKLLAFQAQLCDRAREGGIAIEAGARLFRHIGGCLGTRNCFNTRSSRTVPVQRAHLATRPDRVALAETYALRCPLHAEIGLAKGIVDHELDADIGVFTA
jgi:hypothetical protein